MKNVYDFFAEYYQRLTPDVICKDAVLEGIRAYLDEIGITQGSCDENETAAAAKRELARFRLMPKQTFEAFFDYFEIRARISELVKECELLAINKITKDKEISNEVYKEKMNRFYSLAAELPSDARYKSWIDSTSRDIADSLRCAAGISYTVPEHVAEIIEYSDSI